MIILRAYPALVLLASVFFLSPAFTFIPLLLTGFYLYLRLPKQDIALWGRIRLLTDFFLFFAVAVLFQNTLGLLSVVAALPVLGPACWDLQEISPTSLSHSTSKRRRPTNTCLTLFSISFLLLFLSFPLGNRVLSLASAIPIAFLGILLTVGLRYMPSKPLEEKMEKLRLVAGNKGEVQVGMLSSSKIKGVVLLSSPYDWAKAEPESFYIDRGSSVSLNITATPSLSGPTEIEFIADAVDRWGLIHFPFKIKPVSLYVIPRARYAAWLARKYLEGSKIGTLSLPSTQAALRATVGSRVGIDYSGSRPYQPGDSLRMIDWKHSVKLNELVSKEFSEFKGRPALLLVNLSATDAEEADKLASDIITTALSLAQEDIPCALAAYDHDTVKFTTSTLPPRTCLVKALGIAEQMVSFVSPLKYLAQPDVARLRTNLSRLRQIENKSAEALASLLDIEYRNLEDSAVQNPATAALAAAFAKADRESNLVVISRRNHDAEALAFDTYKYSRMGYAIIDIS
ncbi:MAG: DUF58 domain-containing protein [Dehalococcoidia bacterium]